MRYMLIIILAAVLSGPLSAQTTYTSTASGNWSTMTWTPVGTPGASDNVVIANSHTVTLDAATITINDLTVGQGTSGILRTSQTTSTALQINGNLTIAANGQFTVRSNTLLVASPDGGLAHSIDLKGNLTHNGSVLDFRSGSAGTTLGVINLTLSGTTTCTLSVNTTYSSTNGDFNMITINKTSSAKVVLGSTILTNSGSGTGPVGCFSGVTFTSGNVETGSYTLAYQGSSSSNVSGASSASYVIGNFGRGTSAGSYKDFPVGDANGYRPVSVYSNLGNAYTVVSCIAGNANTGSSSLTGVSLVSPVRYYRISTTTTNNYFRFRPSYGADDGIVPLTPNTDVRVVYSTDDRANWTAIAQTAAPNTAITNPPSTVLSDSLTSHITVTPGNFMYVCLGSVDGETNALPVELSSFTVAAKQGTVQLSWSTATETNNAGFDIEKLVSNNWTKIGNVEGHGTTNAPHSYSFVDAQAKGRAAYRLKQIDRDGAFTYSQTVESNAGLTASDFTLTQNHPNPFNPSTTFSFAMHTAEPVTVTVYNALGQSVAELFNGIANAGEFYTMSFNGSQLSSGTYFYALRSASRNEVRKMVLMK